MFTALVARADAGEDLNRAVPADSTPVRAHRHTAGARKTPGRRVGQPCRRPLPRRTDHQDPPRGRCPLPAARVRPRRRTGRRRARLHRRHGPPARSPAAGSSAHQAGRGPGRRGLLISRDPRPPARARCPGGDPHSGAGGQNHRLRRGRPPAFDREAHKQRNTVERCINRLRQWRGIATRYEKTARPSIWPDSTWQASSSGPSIYPNGTAWRGASCSRPRSACTPRALKRDVRLVAALFDGDGASGTPVPAFLAWTSASSGAWPGRVCCASPVNRPLKGNRPAVFQQTPVYDRLVAERGDVPVQVRGEAERIHRDLAQVLRQTPTPRPSAPRNVFRPEGPSHRPGRWAPAVP
ncbi:hypothetical protein SGRIM128S_02215 [Streptomyces griseomycini]